MMERLMTKVGLPPEPRERLKHGDKVLGLGSCFSEHIGSYIAESGHQIAVNPFGTLYNPCSIIEALKRLEKETPFEEAELFAHRGLYHSRLHHGRYSSTSPSETLARINADYLRGVEMLREAKFLFLTWGTAYVYSERSSAEVVGNCHKRPESDFERRLYSVEELVAYVLPTLKALLERRPELYIISTISPIRHLRDGAHENQLSKATLLLMNEALGRALGERYRYFPAYEIVLDELRDYRYYAEDMTHPSELTIGLIRERFLAWLATPNALALGQRVRRLYAQQRHRPLHPDHPDTLAQRTRLRAEIEALRLEHPELNLELLSEL